jgi:DNA helicase IV
VKNKINKSLNELNIWNTKYNDFFNNTNIIENYNKEELKFPNKLKIIFGIKYFKYLKEYKTLYNKYLNIDLSIKKHNEKYFNEIYGKIENNYLDSNQIDSIINNSSSQLVIASAGSGKTTTIIGKVKYLIKTNKVLPNEILILSFTSSSSKEMKERIEKEINTKIDVYTFHKLGLEIIKKSSLNIPNIYTDNISSFIINTLYELIKDSIFISNLVDYYINIKNNDLITLKEEKVRYKMEVSIANFLYVNNIKYIYNNSFYLTDYNVYISYKNNIKSKNNIIINTKYLNIQSLINELSKYNIKLTPVSNKEMLKILKNNGFYIEISSIFETLINLIKNNNLKIENIRKIKLNHYDKLLLDLLEPIYLKYNEYLKTNNLIDFNDMINLSTKCIKENLFIHNYKYVIVDEYQDISYGRFNLLMSLRNQSFYKLFCVGDDWQSIYRFSGSDISLITDYEKYVGTSYITRIENTYRFSSSIANISSKFIMKNPNQIKKKVNSKINYKNAIKIIENDNYKECLNELEKELLKLENYSTIYLLGRYKSDLEILKYNQNFYQEYNYKDKCLDIIYSKRIDLNIKFLTIHSSKGLQSDYVIILNNKNTGMSFPSKITDLPLINLLLDNSDNFSYSEERRLFYVALTRCKKKVFLLVNSNNKSVFIKEIEKYIS